MVGRAGTARGRRAARTAALLVAAAAVALTASCTTGHDRGPRDDGRAPVKPPATSRTEPAKVPGSVLAVKIDNVPQARPQTGLDAADIVYVEQVEGGLSRLMAVYGTRLPEVVGPVRSARESDLELLRQFHEPTLAFSGAQGRLLPLIDRAELRAEPPGTASDAYFRGPDRPSPHNLFLHPDDVLPKAPGAEGLTTGFTFGAPPAGGTEAHSRTVRYPSAEFRFTWSQERGRWLVAMDGTDAVSTDGGPLAPATVVVQHVKIRPSAFHDSLGNNTPYTETVGSGTAEVLRGGKSYDVKWERPEASDGTRFTTKDGKPVDFADGQVWVVFTKA
ncbi:DUF3048 domain-containing protein [Streptomyces sp. NPDC088387]|uniref:DUF3048 domain-containing protein n=1 Tax=Streptomyces sp. NPDC088387 TaxID=3365859 RepID=UPI003822090F